MVVVDNVGVVDGADGAVAMGDMVGDGGDDGLVGVSLACMPVSQMLGGSVDVPASFSRCGIPSSFIVCVTASTVVVGVIWVVESVVVHVVDSVCTSSSTWIHVRVSTHLPCPSCSSFPLSSPASWPSLQPFWYARFSSSFLFSSSSFLACFFPSSKALAFASSRSFIMTLRSRSLHITAVDVAVVGLQKRPISGIVLRVGIREFPGPGIIADE